MKKILFTISLTLISAITFGQTLLDETGNAFLRNSSTTTTWSGTTNLTLRATAAQTTGFKLSYEADSNPRVGRLTLNNNYGGIYGDFAISLRNGSQVYEQFRIKNNGYVGIGTSSPADRLEVKGNVIRITDGTNSSLWNRLVTNSNGTFSIKNPSGDDHFVINGNRIGIGTNSPEELLDVDGDSEFGTGTGVLKIKQGNLTFDGEERTYLIHDRGTNRKIGLGITDNGSVRNYIELFEGNAPNNQYIDFGIQGVSAMKINAEGKVAIGTTDFSGSHELRVEGSIGAREIKVEASSWSDFVFENDYKLRTLEEVEEHIAEKGHLPEIPSEAEVTENGINLGEMNAKLLQKIEELTLYLIEQNKELKSANQKIEKLQKEVSALKNE